MTNRNDKNRTKTATTIMGALVIVLMMLPSAVIFPNVGATSLHANVPHVPVLSASENRTVVNTALAVSGLQNWSHDWHFVTMGFLSNNEPSNFKWQYAIVELKAPSASAPIQCDNDWWARIVVDMSTLKILESTYPTMESHPCHGPVFNLGSSHAWATATQNDVNSTSNPKVLYYGTYGELATPSFNAQTIYKDLGGAFIGYLINALFTPSSAYGLCTNNSGNCFEQAGWTITACNVSGCLPLDTNDIIYVDESTFNNEEGHLTSLTWKNGYTTTLDAEIDCSVTAPDYGIVTYNGTATDTETTKIPCSTNENNNYPTNFNANSVFFENSDSDTTQNWPSDITSTVSATNTKEYQNSYNSAPISWITSHNVDESCTGNVIASKVITGSLQSGGTADWSSLSNMPHAC